MNFKRLSMMVKASFVASLFFIATGTMWLFLNQQPASAQAVNDELSFFTSDESALYPHQQNDIDINVTELIESGFTRPVHVTHAGDGSGRLFVVEQDGRIIVVEDGAALNTPFLNIQNIVRSSNDTNGGNEQGLLGVAFHPDYENNGYFYINYTTEAFDSVTTGSTVVARYSVANNNPNLADPDSALILLTIEQPARNHNGGQLLFGPDGYLYIGVGDGGGSNDQFDQAQDKTTLLGTILRIDVNNPTNGKNYGIPPGNPYVNEAGADEIWAIGLRNPWRFSFDRETDDLYIGDVGQNQWEEISFQAAGTAGGLNFGWPCREGNHTPSFAPNDCVGPFESAIAEYDHDEGFSVTGGFVYRGSDYPDLQGYYFYADYVTRKIWAIRQTGPNSWSTPQLLINDAGLGISSFGEDEEGELYVTGRDNGELRRLASVNGAVPDLSTSTKTASTPHADPNETVDYTIRLRNSNGLSDETFSLTDTIPNGLTYVNNSLSATQGQVDDSQAPTLTWQGDFSTNSDVIITYQVQVTGDVTGTLINQATVTGLNSDLTLQNGLFVPRPALTTDGNDFFFPGTQPNQLSATIPNPAGCDFCHTDPIYNEWRGSMMAQAGRDPLLWAAMSVANNDAPGAGDYCLRCHAPKGWLEGRSHPEDGSALALVDITAGVACEVCHRMVDPVPSTSDEAVTIDASVRAALTSTLPSNHVGSAMLIVDPADNRRGPFAFPPGNEPPHTALRTDFLGQSTNYVTESRLCGTCHNVDNPVLSWDSDRNQYWPNETNTPAPSFEKGDLFPIERTYDEWLNSDYVNGVYAPQFAGARPDGIVGSCQDCHMPRTTGLAAEDIYNPVFRDCQTTGCLPSHELVGGNSWVPQLLQDTRWRLNAADEAMLLDNTTDQARQMLQKAATMTAILTGEGSNKVAIVRVINEAGHKLPTGYPEGRRMWINLKAYDGDNTLIYESGAYDADTGVLTQDAAIKVYEAKQGLTPELAQEVDLPAGESFHFVLNNQVVKDNRIPPRGYTVAAFDQPGLRPVGATYADGQYWDETTYAVPSATERITARLYYQVSSKAYIDFLRKNGGLDGATLGQLWDDSKSPPDLMAVAFDPIWPTYLPLIFK